MIKIIKSLGTIISILFIILICDFVSVYTRGKPVFYKEEKNKTVYKGLFFDTYNCEEFSVPKIVKKTEKFNCAVENLDLAPKE